MYLNLLRNVRTVHKISQKQSRILCLVCSCRAAAAARNRVLSGGLNGPRRIPKPDPFLYICSYCRVVVPVELIIDHLHHFRPVSFASVRAVLDRKVTDHCEFCLHPPRDDRTVLIDQGCDFVNCFRGPTCVAVFLTKELPQNKSCHK